MEKFTVEEVVEQAIQTEVLGHQFYTGMMERFKDNADLKKLFDMLATKELEHKATFQTIKAGVAAGQTEGWEDVSLYMKAIVESEFFLGKHKSLPDMSRIKTVKDAVHFAIGFEKETVLYFLGLRGVVAKKDAVDAIIEEEKSHIRDLSAFLKACCL